MDNKNKTIRRIFFSYLLIGLSACAATSSDDSASPSSSNGAADAIGTAAVGAVLSSILQGGGSNVQNAAGVVSESRGNSWLVPLAVGVAKAVYNESRNDVTPTYYPENQKVVPNEFVVVSKNGQAASFDSTFVLKEKYSLRALGVTINLLSNKDKRSNTQQASKLIALKKQNPNATVQANYYYYLNGSNAKPIKSVPQYALKLIDYDGKSKQGGNGIKIGIIDTPLDKQHPAFKRSRISQKDFVASKGKLHATALAGILVGSGRIQGIVPNASITSVGAFEEKTGSRSSGKSTSFLLSKAFDHIIASRVNILNLSFGSTEKDPLMKRLIAETLKRKITIVASVGNDGNGTKIRYPAAFDGVLGITAINSKSQLYNRANTGNAVDYALPGVNVITSKPGGRYTSISGTSFANAYAAGLIALHFSKYKNLNSLNNSVKDLGKSGKDKQFGYGLLQTPR